MVLYLDQPTEEVKRDGQVVPEDGVSGERGLRKSLRRDSVRVMRAVECLADVAEQETAFVGAGSSAEPNVNSEAAERATKEVENQVTAITQSVLANVYDAANRDKPETADDLAPRPSCVQAATQYISLLTRNLVPALAEASAEPGASEQTALAMAPTVDTSRQLLDAVTEAVFADLTLKEGNTAELDAEHRRTTAYIQQALTELAIAEVPPTKEPPDRRRADTYPQEAPPQALARRKSAMPLSSPADSDAGAAGSRRSRAGSAQEAPEATQAPSQALQIMNARRKSAMPLSSPLNSDAGAAGSGRSSQVSAEGAAQTLALEGLGTQRPANIALMISDDSQRPSVQQSGGGDADLQQLLAECRKTRRSTVRLLGDRSPQGSDQAQVPSNRQGSGASSINTVLLEAPEDGRKNSKQEAAASFISALVQKAIVKVEAHEFGLNTTEPDNGRRGSYNTDNGDEVF